MHVKRDARGGFRLLMGAALLLILTLGLCGCAAEIRDADVIQERLDTATLPLDGSHLVSQTFTCQLPNLCEIELLPAVYGAPGNGTLTLHLRSATPDHGELARQTLHAASVRSNVPFAFRFGPLRDSTNETYELLAEGSPGVQAGLWYNSVDAYGGGKLTLDGATSAGDLRFITRCRYDLPVLLRGLSDGLPHSAPLVIPLTLLLVVPGCLLWHTLRPLQDQDPVSNLAFGLALSLALVPTALLWSTVLGLHWGRSLCWAAAGGLALCALLRLVRTRGRDLLPWIAAQNRGPLLAASGLLALTLLLRFAQIRGLVLPAWVDSPQHALVTQLVILQGQVPRSYQPLLPTQSFVYHFGFHADVAVLHWLSGLAVPQAVLILGQVLNAAAALTAYLLTLRLTGRKLAATAALAIVGLVSYMPAYYVTWGRYTQLTGLVLLPAALVGALDWLESDRRDYRLLCLAGVLQTGLVLTHARVTVFGACFLLACGLYQSASLLWRRDRPKASEFWLRVGMLVLLALVLSGPWLLQVTRGFAASVRASGQAPRGDAAYNALPLGLLLVPRNRGLMVLAAVGVMAGLLRRRRGTILVVAWVGLVALALNPGWLGLANTNLVNNAAAVIALYLPLAVLGGEAVTGLWDGWRCVLSAVRKRLRTPRWAGAAAQAVLVASIGVALLRSAWGLVSIVNPVTVLAMAEDVQAMQWIQANTPPEAVFLINARLWQLGIYTGSDGGYWIPQLTGRRALLPVLPYVYGAPDYVQHVSELAKVVSEVKDADDPGLQSVVQQEGVTHVYIGAKGGALTPQMFLCSARFRPVYCTGAVWIFEVVRGEKKQGTVP